MGNAINHIYNLIYNTSLGIIILNLIPTYIKGGFSAIVDDRIKTMALIVSIIVAIVKAVDLGLKTYDANVKRKIENKELEINLKESEQEFDIKYNHNEGSRKIDTE